MKPATSLAIINNDWQLREVAYYPVLVQRALCLQFRLSYFLLLAVDTDHPFHLSNNLFIAAAKQTATKSYQYKFEKLFNTAVIISIHLTWQTKKLPFNLGFCQESV